MLAAATVDRLLHHAHVLLTEGTDKLPPRPGDRRQGGEASPLTDVQRADRRYASPYGLGSATNGALPMGTEYWLA